MESLAFLVFALLVIMALSGVSALYLSFKKTKPISNVTTKPLQRIITIFLGLISFIIGVQFVTQVDSLGGRVIGGFGIAIALVALYRVFKK
jgi:hypothetical protein